MIVGATIQGSIGFGMGLVAAPVLAIVDPAFVPVSIVIGVIPLGIGVVVARSRPHRSPRDRAGHCSAGCPGVLIGARLVHVAGHRAVSAVIGVSVLLAVVGSLSTWRLRPSSRNLVIAGLASGITGTAAGIGGPPMALTYQHADAARLRGTLGAFFLAGGMLSIGALALDGLIGRHELELAALVAPAVVVGFALSRVLGRRLAATAVRPLILGLCSASALVLLVDTFR